MIVYLVLALIIIFLPTTKLNKKYYCIIVGTIMTLIVSLRSINLGMGDTKEIYANIFRKLTNMSFKGSYKYIVEQDIEMVFYMLTRLFICICQNFRIYIFLVTLPFFIATTRINIQIF